MEKRARTTRGEMTGPDKQVISALANESKTAFRIFVTKEMRQRQFGAFCLKYLEWNLTK